MCFFFDKALPIWEKKHKAIKKAVVLKFIREGYSISENKPWVERNPFQGYFNNVRNYIRSSANGKVINWIITVIRLERKMIKACDILSAFPFSYYYVHSVENLQLIGVGSGYNL